MEAELKRNNKEEFENLLLKHFYFAKKEKKKEVKKDIEIKNDFLNYGKFEKMERVLKEEEEKEEKEKKHKESHNHSPYGCLSSHEKENDIYKKSNKEKFESIIFFKEKGNKEFMNNNYEKALFFYTKANIYIIYLIPEKEEYDQYVNLEISINLNMAFVLMKQKEYRKALNDHISLVLNKDPLHKKALYRKAKCFYLLDEFENCQDVLDILNDNYKTEDEDIKNLERDLRKKIIDYQNKVNKLVKI